MAALLELRHGNDERARDVAEQYVMANTALTHGLHSTLGANPERAKSIWFSHAYAPFFSGAFAAPDVSVAAIGDFSGKTIGVTGGTLEDLFFRVTARDDDA